MEKTYIEGLAEPLEEDYLPEEWKIMNDGFTFQVPEGCHLMLGDNKNNSSDCRYRTDEAIRKGLAENEKETEQYQYYWILS